MAARVPAFLFYSLLSAAPLHASVDNSAPYSIGARIPGGPGGAWDYAVVDSRNGSLYLAQGGITALDLKSHKVAGGLVDAKITHGVAVLRDGRIAVDDSQTKTILVFDAAGNVTTSIDTAAENPVNGIHALDALVVDPHSGLLTAVNGESGLLLLVDVAQARVVGTIEIGGHPEFAAADGLGTLYVNVNRGKRSEIVGIDIDARRILRHYPLAGCEEATGLAYDATMHLLMAVCDNGRFKAINAADGSAAATLKVGTGADAVMWDEKRRVAFVASGDAGTLSVIRVTSPTNVALIQVLATQRGTRLGAVDVDSGTLYLPAARFGPPKPPIPYPSVVPGSFEFLMITPHSH